jgi:predicted transposase YdaD
VQCVYLPPAPPYTQNGPRRQLLCEGIEKCISERTTVVLRNTFVAVLCKAGDSSRKLQLKCHLRTGSVAQEVEHMPSKCRVQVPVLQKQKKGKEGRKERKKGRKKGGRKQGKKEKEERRKKERKERKKD